MKRNKRRKLFSLGIAMAIVFSLAACSQGAGEESTQENPQDSSQESSQTVQTEESVSQEKPETAENDLTPITLTWGFKVADAPGGDGVHLDNAALKAIEEKTGVTIEIVTYDADKFNMLAAGGDLPDIIETEDGNNAVNNLITSGQLLPLEDLLDQYGENIKENIPDVLHQVKMTRGGGEHIYYLPTNITYIGNVPEKNGFIDFKARYDIYKEIGSPEISTEDDYLEVLRQMQEHQREKTGDDSIYALSSWTDSGMWPYIITYPFAYGLMDDFTGYSLDLTTGEIHSNFMEEDGAFWKGIRFFNKAYQLGIFDPDGLTQKNAQYIEKVNNGKILASGNGAQPNPDICGEDAVIVNLPGTAFPEISGVYGTPYPFGYGSNCARAITTNCEYPERAMQLLNWLDTTEGARTIANGIQGVDWDYVDGVPQLIGDMLESYKTGSNVPAEYRDGRNALLYGAQFMFSGNNAVVTEDGYPIFLNKTIEFYSEMATPAEKAFAQDFDPEFSYPGQVYAKWVEEGIVTTITTDLGRKKAAFGPTLSDDSAEKQNEASNYFLSNISRLIMAQTEEDFEREKASMIDKFKEIGLEECDREVIKSREESFKAYEEMFGK